MLYTCITRTICGRYPPHCIPPVPCFFPLSFHRSTSDLPVHAIPLSITAESSISAVRPTVSTPSYRALDEAVRFHLALAPPPPPGPAVIRTPIEIHPHRTRFHMLPLHVRLVGCPTSLIKQIGEKQRS